MERQIGERFKYKDKTLEVVEGEKDFCGDCYFRYSFMNLRCAKEVTGFCSRRTRKDCKDVIFKEIEK